MAAFETELQVNRRKCSTLGCTSLWSVTHRSEHSESPSTVPTAMSLHESDPTRF